MNDITTLVSSTDDPIALIAAKGNYAIIAAKGTAARLRTYPEGSQLTPADAAALLAPLC